LEEISSELAGVEASLRRLDDGTYGTCEVCGIPIEAVALEADPLHSRCPDHPR
jgi:RNA polymerase-binding transcription factor DksA